MKGLKKVALASAIAAVSAGAQAELKALDDSAMGELTGQAGLTIDIETKWSIGEFQYKDAGSVLLTGISMGGNELEDATYVNAGGSYLDNIRMTIDVAGAGAVDGITTEITGTGSVTAATLDNTFNYGFSEIKGLATAHVGAGNTDAGIVSAAVAGFDSTTGLIADAKRSYGDGDLVIHWGFNDAWEKGGGFAAYFGTTTGGIGGTAAAVDFATARDIATRAVDFNFQIDAIGLASSGFTTGATIGDAEWDATGTTAAYEEISESFNDGIDTDTSDTVLISGLELRGYLGPADLHIENNGNGFGADGSGLGGAAGSGNADSKITWGSYFRITDLDVYLDIAGLFLGDVQINNTRGDLTGIDGTSAFGFAHSIRTIYAVKDTVLQVGTTNGVNGQSATSGNPDNFVDGLALNTQFKGDIDIGELSFGDTRKSIGEIYLTDIESDTRWTISAH